MGLGWPLRLKTSRARGIDRATSRRPRPYRAAPGEPASPTSSSTRALERSGANPSPAPRRGWRLLASRTVLSAGGPTGVHRLPFARQTRPSRVVRRRAADGELREDGRVRRRGDALVAPPPAVYPAPPPARPPAGSSGHHRQSVPPPAARPRSAAPRRRPRTRPPRPSSPPGGEPDAEPAEDLAVRVAVRARPLVAKERLERARECLSYPDDKSVLLGQNRLFHFDDAYGPGSEQGAIYRDLVAPLVESCFNGYNATVFAYGQTGSGKTYRWAAARTQRPRGRGGIIPRVISDVFAGAKRRRGQSEVSVRCAFLEVHNEEARDLPHPEGGYDDGAGAPGRKKISVRERADGAIVRADQGGGRALVREMIRPWSAAARDGRAGRDDAESAVRTPSSPSSWSRGISRASSCSFTGRTASRNSTSWTWRVRSGISARARRSAGGETGINSGLLALGNVISALADAEGEAEACEGGAQPSRRRTPRTPRGIRSAGGGVGGGAEAPARALPRQQTDASASGLSGRELEDVHDRVREPDGHEPEETLNTLDTRRGRGTSETSPIEPRPAAAQLAAIREDANNAGAFDRRARGCLWRGWTRPACSAQGRGGARRARPVARARSCRR